MATLTLAGVPPGLITWTLSPWKPGLLILSNQVKSSVVWAAVGACASTSLKDWKYCTRWEASTGWSEVTWTGPPKPLAQVKIASPPLGMVPLGLQPGWPGMATLTLAGVLPGLITWTLSPWKPGLLILSNQVKSRVVWAAEGVWASTSLKDWKYCTRWEASTGWSEPTITGPPKPVGQVKICSPCGATMACERQPGEPGMFTTTVAEGPGLAAGLMTWMLSPWKPGLLMRSNHVKYWTNGGMNSSAAAVPQSVDAPWLYSAATQTCTPSGSMAAPE